MSKAVKAAALGLAMFVTVWVVTLWQWYRSQQQVSGEEVATQLILLPMGLTLIAWLAWWGAERLRLWSAKPVEAVRSGPSVAAAPFPAQGREPAGATLGGTMPADSVPLGLASIVAEALTLPNGEEPQQACSALRSGRLRPGLDPHLRDADGMPVFSSRMPDLSSQDWLDAHGEVNDASLPESLLRAMALIEAPLHRLLSALPLVEDADGDDRVGGGQAGGPRPGLSEGRRVDVAVVPSQAILSGVGQPGARERASHRREQAPALDIQVWVPADWPPEHRALFIGWLRQQAGGALDWARASGSGEPRWFVETLDTPEAGWDCLLPRLSQLHTDTRPRLLMVLAAHSLVDEASVAGLQARGELFTSQHQGGRVPGEGAAGLLLANAAMAVRCAEPEHPWLGVPGVTQRQRSADRAGRPGADDLVIALKQALAPWMRWRESEKTDSEKAETQKGQAQGQAQEQTQSQEAWWCLSDADHRPGRASELFEAFQAMQPHVDPTQAVLRLGVAWGDLGIARALVPVALAASLARQGLQPGDDAVASSVGLPAQAPVLVGLLQGSHRRLAIPVWPASVGRAALNKLSPARAPAPAINTSSAASVAEPMAA